jgi:hypothetical protein
VNRIALLLLAGCRSILGIDDPSQVCLAQSTYEPVFDDTNQAATSVPTNSIVWEAVLDATTNIEIQLRPQTPDFPLMLGPLANIDLGNFSDAQTSTCGACVLLAAGLDSSRANPTQIYLAESGRLDITAASTTMVAGSLTDAVFTPVVLGANNASTRVDQQCTTIIAKATFSAAVAP